MPQRFYLPLWFTITLMLAAATGALAQADPKALRQ